MYYKYHVFFCINQREADLVCCANHGSAGMRDYAKARVKELGLAGAGGVRVNTAGCLDRCPKGPVMVIYPEGAWYTYENQADIDEIIKSHLQDDQPVERLRLLD